MDCSKRNCSSSSLCLAYIYAAVYLALTENRRRQDLWTTKTGGQDYIKSGMKYGLLNFFSTIIANAFNAVRLKKVEKLVYWFSRHNTITESGSQQLNNL